MNCIKPIIERARPRSWRRPVPGVSSFDDGQRPSHGCRCDHQYDGGYEHQTQQTEYEHMLSHFGAYSAYATPAM
jgi:hypothetical protein